MCQGSLDACRMEKNLSPMIKSTFETSQASLGGVTDQDSCKLAIDSLNLVICEYTRALIDDQNQVVDRYDSISLLYSPSKFFRNDTVSMVRSTSRPSFSETLVAISDIEGSRLTSLFTSIPIPR